MKEKEAMRRADKASKEREKQQDKIVRYQRWKDKKGLK